MSRQKMCVGQELINQLLKITDQTGHLIVILYNSN